GYPEQAILVYKKGLEIDNSAELFYQRLMILYKSLGRSAEAVAVYRRCEAIVSRILNMGTSDKTKEIYQNIIK
ncbi:MAG: bacterial transcriptional activator domain-containing protein, partial [Deltaproteobacteria bacterium]|nr:bacterial transcriptional activator domain-containing protein [Deltaproteobacteria bacterium]